MFHSCSQTSVGQGLLRILLTLTTLLLTTAAAQTQQPPPQSDTPAPRTDSRQIPTSQPSSGQTQPAPPQSGTPQPRTNSRQTPASQPPSGDGHHTDTNPGQTPHGSSNGAAIAAGTLGGVAAGIVIGELIAHHNASPEHFGHDGPQVPKELDMSSFVIKGLVGPNWPVVLDFLIDSPGSVQIDITAADKHHFRATMTNPPNRRAYGIFHLPPDFGSKLQTAVFQVRSIPAGTTTTGTNTAAPNTAAPGLRTYGIGAGEKAVGSVAIDQLTFQPPAIHPKAKEVATYGFHAHSAFNGVRAEFIFTTLYNGHVLVQQDQEEKLSPIPEGERARGTWEGKGKAGQHMLQIRAWRGLENGGDWVVAWSPDIVEVIK
jgi:hypothetical protein